MIFNNNTTALLVAALMVFLSGCMVQKSETRQDVEQGRPVSVTIPDQPSWMGKEAKVQECIKQLNQEKAAWHQKHPEQPLFVYRLGTAEDTVAESKRAGNFKDATPLRTISVAIMPFTFDPDASANKAMAKQYENAFHSGRQKINTCVHLGRMR